MKDGGQAFPVAPGHIDQNGTAFFPEYGMTLRDYFAGQALAGLLSDQDRDLYPHEYAELSYKIADAMLKEREK